MPYMGWKARFFSVVAESFDPAQRVTRVPDLGNRASFLPD
jgi:hypothetical protein